MSEPGLGRGGTISATGRPRSVTTIVSPEAAARTYLLGLFLRVLRPKVRIRARWPPEATVSMATCRAEVAAISAKALQPRASVALGHYARVVERDSAIRTEFRRPARRGCCGRGRRRQR